jgi:cytidylate kinase
MITIIPPYQETITCTSGQTTIKTYKTNRTVRDFCIYIISKAPTTATINIKYGDTIQDTGSYTTSQKIVHVFTENAIFPALAKIDGTDLGLFDLVIEINNTGPTTDFIILILGAPVKDI